MKLFRRLAITAALVAGGFTAVGMAQNAQAADGQILTSSHIDNITISPTLNCSVHRNGDTTSSFFGSQGNACGTFLAAGGVLYGPAAFPGGDAAGLLQPRTAFTPVSQTPVVGIGTLEDPYKVTTVVNAGDQFRVSQVDSYSLGREYYRTQITVERTGAAAGAAVKVWHAADCKTNGNDNGFGFKKAVDTVGCQSENTDHTRATQIVEFVPREGDSSYFEGSYASLYQKIGQQLPFDDTCKCNDIEDNAAGLSWAFTVDGPTAVSLFKNFSPSGHSIVNEVPFYWSIPNSINAFLSENNTFTIDARDFDPFVNDFPVHTNWDDPLTVTVDPPASGDFFTVGQTNSIQSRDRVVSNVTVVPTQQGDFTLKVHISDGYYTVDKDVAVHVAKRPTTLKVWAATIDLSGPSKIPLAMNATLLSNGVPVPNKVVILKASPNGGSCVITTNAAGYGSCQIVISAVQAVLGLGAYEGIFPGDNRYEYAYARGRLIQLGLLSGSLPLP